MARALVLPCNRAVAAGWYSASYCRSGYTCVDEDSTLAVEFDMTMYVIVLDEIDQGTEAAPLTCIAPRDHRRHVGCPFDPFPGLLISLW